MTQVTIVSEQQTRTRRCRANSPENILVLHNLLSHSKQINKQITHPLDCPFKDCREKPIKCLRADSATSEPPAVTSLLAPPIPLGCSVNIAQCSRLKSFLWTFLFPAKWNNAPLKQKVLLIVQQWAAVRTCWWKKKIAVCVRVCARAYGCMFAAVIYSSIPAAATFKLQALFFFCVELSKKRRPSCGSDEQRWGQQGQQWQQWQQWASDVNVFCTRHNCARQESGSRCETLIEKTLITLCFLIPGCCWWLLYHIKYWLWFGDLEIDRTHNAYVQNWDVYIYKASAKKWEEPEGWEESSWECQGMSEGQANSGRSQTHC